MRTKRTLIFLVLLFDIAFCFIPLARAAHTSERVDRVVSTMQLVTALSRK